MSDLDRRQFMKGILAKLAQAAGTVVVASAVASTARAQGSQSETPKEGVRERADRLTAGGEVPAGGAESGAVSFLNGAFRNTPLGGFRNTPLGGFRNTPLGNFRNSPLGTFRNTPLGSFGNSSWPNGGWPNGGWGGFGNGGWPNGAWRNWW